MRYHSLLDQCSLHKTTPSTLCPIERSHRLCECCVCHQTLTSMMLTQLQITDGLQIALIDALVIGMLPSATAAVAMRAAASEARSEVACAFLYGRALKSQHYKSDMQGTTHQYVEVQCAYMRDGILKAGQISAKLRSNSSVPKRSPRPVRMFCDLDFF